ncbi:homeobox domain-containing protein [Haematococcus lacustris]|uniref:Homeobox domain-containing protein n=1 Tax=Haematococcus lacustris TaxID=44745 RepID=A0A699ZMJ9_HAELA|nr:homeobox domain-containing protein [Haematococcus lacustris]
MSNLATAVMCKITDGQAVMAGVVVVVVASRMGVLGLLHLGCLDQGSAGRWSETLNTVWREVVAGWSAGSNPTLGEADGWWQPAVLQGAKEVVVLHAAAWSWNVCKPWRLDAPASICFVSLANPVFSLRDPCQRTVICGYHAHLVSRGVASFKRHFLSLFVLVSPCHSTEPVEPFRQPQPDPKCFGPRHLACSAALTTADGQRPSPSDRDRGCRDCQGDVGLFGVAEGEQQLEEAVMLHPLYPRLLEAVMACRKVGLLNVADMNAIDQQCVQAQAAAVAAQHAARQAGGHLLEMAQDPELQAFMASGSKGWSLAITTTELELGGVRGCRGIPVGRAHSLIVDLGTNGAALAQLSRYPTHVPALSFAPTGTESWPRDHSPLQASLSRSTAGDSTGSSVGSSGAASGSLAGCSSADTSSARVEVEHLGNALKRQYADRLSALQKEFNCKRSKGKLPDEAIEQLKQWWQQHPYWPYPTASDGSQARQPVRPDHPHTWCQRVTTDCCYKRV